VIWSAIGAICLGAVVGWLIVYSLRRLEQMTVQSLAGIVALAVGGVITRFLEFDKRAFPFYPMGLALGFLLYITTLPIRMKWASPPELLHEVQRNREEIGRAKTQGETNEELLRNLLAHVQQLIPGDHFSSDGVQTSERSIHTVESDQ
jgi:hypothetical protein